MISVNFDPTSYVVNEGDSTNVRVVLSNPSSSAITVELFTEVGTAGSEYDPCDAFKPFKPPSLWNWLSHES